MMIKYILIVSILTTFNLFAANNNKITLQLSWKHQFQFAGYYIAKELGYYEDAGLDVELKEFDFGVDLSTVIEQGKAEFAVGRSSLLIDKIEGKDIVALGAIYQYSPLMLLVRGDSGIEKIKDLKGKRVMITHDAKGTASVIAMLNSKNILLRDIKVQDHSFDLDDLINKKTDAMASYISNEPIRMADRGIDYKIFHPKDFGFDFYSDILFTSSVFIKENPKLTRSFYEASIRGWKYAFENIGKSAEIIYNKYNTQNKSLIHLVSEGEALKKLIHHENTDEIGCLDKNKLQKIVDIYKVMGIIDRDLDLDSFIYRYNNHKTVNLNLSHNDIYFILFTGVLGLAVIIGSIFYFTVKRKWLITKQELEEEVIAKTKELELLTLIDPLTKANNRKAYDMKMEELVSLYKRYGTPFSMAIFDIDDFKLVNDTYGHKEGDRVLIDLVDLVNSNIRQSDHFFRIGGEEFVILFSHTALEEAQVVAQKIKTNIAKELNSAESENITVSIGLTKIRDDDTEDSIYTRADGLMYESKHNGKNKITSG